MRCPNCQAENTADSVFCTKCGHKLDVAQPSDATTVQATTCEKNAPGTSCKFKSLVCCVKPKPLYTASNLLAFLAAFASFLFLFAIGASSATKQGSLTLTESPYVTLYYFFDDVYRTDVTMTAAQNNVYTTGAVLGTVVCALGIICTTVCFLITAIRSINAVKKASKKSLLPVAAATFLSFLCTAVLFKHCIALENQLPTMKVAQVFTLNGATIAGITIGAIALLMSIVANAVAKVKEGNSCGRMLSDAVATGILGIIAVVLVSMLAKGVFTYVDSNETTMTYGLSSLLMEISSTFSSELSDLSLVSNFIIISAVAVVVAIATCTLLTVAFAKTAGASEKVTQQSTVLLFIFGGLGAMILGALMIVLGGLFLTQKYSTYESVIRIVTPSVFVIISGVLLLVGSVVYRVIRFPADNEKDETNTAETQQQAEQQTPETAQ